MEDCIFCKIARGEIESYLVWEDDNFFAMLDINPYVKGHVLVMPKKHSRWVWDIEDEDYCEYMKVVKYFANVLRKAFDTEWIEELIAGKDVAHSHIHLFPRREDDGFAELPKSPLNPKPSEEEMKEILGKIKNNL